MCLSAFSQETSHVHPKHPPILRLSTDAWAILLAAALGLIIRFGLLKTIAW